jgi:phosphatidylglycerol:prolipoprotein diacylglycerol transferase
VDKVAFQFGFLTITWYGLMVAGGILIGAWTASRRALRDNLHPEMIFDLLFWLTLGAIVGARVLYVLTYWQNSFAGMPWWHVLAVWHGGLVFHGGLVGSALAVVIYTRVRQLPLWKVADALAPSIPLGHVLGRAGCFINGCCYGSPTALPWAVHYPADHETHGYGIHPTQLYEAGLDFMLYLVLAWLYRRKRFDGQVFALYLVAYAFLRSFVELFRGDYPRLTAGWITPAHWVSLILLGAGLALLRWLPRRAVATAPAKP